MYTHTYPFVYISIDIHKCSNKKEVFKEDMLKKDVNILGGSAHTVKENAEALLVATEETELEVNADKTKYMVMSRDRNAGRGHSVKIDNSSIERVEAFKYLGTTLTDQNSIQEEIKSRLKLGNACHYSVQNLLSSRLLSKHLKIKIHVYIEL